MDPYEQLRDRARSRRDELIRKAQKECRAALRKIDDLERKVGQGGEPPAEGTRSKSKRVFSLAVSLLPKSGAFTAADMRRWLTEAEPDRRFPEPTVRTCMRRLAELGHIYAKERGYASEVLWGVCESPEPAETPFALLHLPQAAEIVLRDRGPLRAMDLCVAIQERGNRTTDAPKRVLKSLLRALRKRSDVFVRDNQGKWRFVQHERGST